jgi:hypothetical protein
MKIYSGQINNLVILRFPGIYVLSVISATQGALSSAWVFHRAALDFG